MTEKEHKSTNHTAEDQQEAAANEQGVKKSGPPQKKKPDATVKSLPAHLPGGKTVQLTYQPTPPSRPRQDLPEEPSKQVPVVPPGDYEEDTDESPPVEFEEPAQDQDQTGSDESDVDDENAAKSD